MACSPAASPALCRPARAPLWALIFGVIALSACGHAQVQMRPDDALGCVDRARKIPVLIKGAGPQKARVLGWFSAASMNRWVAEIDRVGQRAGVFAAGSSYRDHLRERASDAMKELGIAGIDWLDDARPLHIVFQRSDATEYGGKKVSGSAAWLYGLSVIVPTRGADVFAAALGPDLRMADSQGHGHALKASREPVFVDAINHYTEVVTIHPERFSLAEPTARCMHTRSPRELLNVGVAVGDLFAANRGKLKTLLDNALKDRQRTGDSQDGGSDDKVDAAVGKLFAWAAKYVAQMDVMQVTANADDQGFSFGFSMRALPDTDAARRLERMANAKPNTLLLNLPGTAWYATGQTYDGMYDPTDYDAIFDLYAGVLNLGDDIVARLRSFVRESVALLGDHGASAMYVDGRFPFAYIGAYESKDPVGLLRLFQEGIVDLIRLAEQAQKKTAAITGKPRKPMSPKGQELLDKLKSQSVGALIDELVKASETWPVRFAYADHKDGELLCRVLSAQADMAQVATNPMALRVIGITGPELQASLCTTDRLLMTLLGPNTVRDAKRLALGQGAKLADNPAFKRLRGEGKPPASLMMIDPGPLVALFGKMMPIPIRWPTGEAIGMTCRGATRSMRCDLRLPYALIDVARQVREAFAGFGRKGP